MKIIDLTYLRPDDYRSIVRAQLKAQRDFERLLRIDDAKIPEQPVNIPIFIRPKKKFNLLKALRYLLV